MDNFGNEGSASDLLRVTQVTKSFGGKLAVKNVSLVMGESSVTALLGPNGAGKTTLTNMMRGEMVPDKGRIYVEGVEVQGNLQMARRSIGGKSKSFIYPSITNMTQFVHNSTLSTKLLLDSN